MPRTSALVLSVAVLLGGFATPAAAGPDVTWQPCPSSPPEHPAVCTSVSVPVNWSRPGAERLDLAVAKLPAARPEERIGTLLFNPGGPGGGAADIVSFPAAVHAYFPPEIRDRFDIVGMDPRGVAGSAAVTCSLPPHEPSVSRFPETDAELGMLLDQNAAFAESCRDGSGNLVEHLGTDDVARDMDAVRAALGEEQISFLGLSYGTMLAQSYAEQFPHRLRSLVLDGVVDRSRTWQRMVEDVAVAVEDGTGRFARWCRENDDCALGDPRATIDRLLTEADAGRLTVDGRAVAADEVSAAINGGASMSAQWPKFAESLRTAQDSGDATALASNAFWYRPEVYTPYRAIICQDVPVREAGDIPGEARRSRELAPTLRGQSEFWDIASGCAGWPVETSWRPHPWTGVENVPTLVLSGAHDMSTPRAWAESVHRQIPGSTMHRWDGDGHTAWLNDSAARDVGIDHLLRHEG